MKACTGCGEMTDYLCPFCRVIEGSYIPVCEEAECREKHEQSVFGCVRTRKSADSQPSVKEKL